MTTPYLAGDVKICEGLRLHAYPDPDSPLAKALLECKPAEGLSGAPWTIGYGHTGPDVYPGLEITKAQAEDLLAKDLRSAQQQLDQRLAWWRSLNDPRQDVIVQLAF